jgi:protein phosphatase
LGLIACGNTDRGLRRSINEDAFFMEDSTGLFAVADGMGGHEAGEVASNMALDTINEYLWEESNPGSEELLSAISAANTEVYNTAQENPSKKGMGTTVVVALINGRKMDIAHVGDSRAYLIRDGFIERLTEDHSLVAEQVRDGLITEEEAERSPVRNIITRAIGIGPEVEADHRRFELKSGDRVLICSDGLYNMVCDEDILSEVLSEQEPGRACESLIEMANGNGGKDNITIVMVLYKKSGIGSLIDWFASLFN